MRCVAVPVGGPGATLAAMSLSGPSDRFAGGRTEGLVEAMQHVGRAFGTGSPPHQVAEHAVD